nr:hypothetical protein [Tanacetum cinerariifolium]
MSTPAHFDLEIISQTPLLVVPSPVPSSDDLHLIVGQAHTPATIDTEFEPEEAPSKIEEFQPLVFKAPFTNEEFEYSEPSDTRITSSRSLASSGSTAPLSPGHLLTKTSPTSTPTRVLFYRRTTRMETPSPSSSSTLPIRRRYQGTSELVEDTKDESSDSNAKREGSDDEGHGLKDEGPGSEEEEEEAAPEDPKDDRVYTDILTYVPPVAPVQTSPSTKWSYGSLPVSPSSPVVTTLIASPATTPAANIWRAEMSQARYDDHRLIHDMLVQHAAMQRELQEMRGRVATLEHERSRKDQ